MTQISLYRVVGEAEREDLATRGCFRLTPESVQAKLFWESRQSADRFVGMISRVEPAKHYVIEVQLKLDVLQHLPDALMDSMPARIVDKEMLAWFNESMVHLHIPEIDANG